jgi:hypothetical protein
LDRTIIGRKHRTDRTSVKRLIKLGIDRSTVNSEKTRKRARDALPKRIKQTLEERAALILEAKGLGKVMPTDGLYSGVAGALVRVPFRLRFFVFGVAGTAITAVRWLLLGRPYGSVAGPRHHPYRRQDLNALGGRFLGEWHPLLAAG